MQDQRADVGELLQDRGVLVLVIGLEGLRTGGRAAIPHEIRHHNIHPSPKRAAAVPRLPRYVDILRRHHKIVCPASPRFICSFRRRQPTFCNDCGAPFTKVMCRIALAELSTSAAAASLNSANDAASSAPKNRSLMDRISALTRSTASRPAGATLSNTPRRSSGLVR